MKITFDHISIKAKNLELITNFLIYLLGLKKGFRPDSPFPGYWLYSEKVEKSLNHIFNEDASFYKKDLINEKIKEESTGKNIVNHMCFYSDNYEEIMHKINKEELDYSIKLVPDCPIKQIFVKLQKILFLKFKQFLKIS